MSNGFSSKRPYVETTENCRSRILVYAKHTDGGNLVMDIVPAEKRTF